MGRAKQNSAAVPFLISRTPPLPHSTHRSDGQMAYGYSLMRGRRATMEDFHHAAVSLKGEVEVLAASFFDILLAPHALTPTPPSLLNAVPQPPGL